MNELQKTCNPKGAVNAIRDANKTAESALQNVDFKMTFPANHLDWTKDLAVVTFSDACFAGEAGYKSKQGSLHYTVYTTDLKAGNIISISSDFPPL